MTPKSPTKKLPRARVMYQDLDGSIHKETIPAGGGYPAPVPVAVIPTRTSAQARQLAKLHNMTPEERESLMLDECTRQEKAEDEGWEPGRIDIIRGYLTALGFSQ